MQQLLIGHSQKHDLVPRALVTAALNLLAFACLLSKMLGLFCFMLHKNDRKVEVAFLYDKKIHNFFMLRLKGLYLWLFPLKMVAG